MEISAQELLDETNAKWADLVKQLQAQNANLTVTNRALQRQIDTMKAEATSTTTDTTTTQED